jgi:hypothetical protein
VSEAKNKEQKQCYRRQIRQKQTSEKTTAKLFILGFTQKHNGKSEPNRCSEPYKIIWEAPTKSHSTKKKMPQRLKANK